MQTNIYNEDKFFAEVAINDAVNQLKKEVEMETWRRAEEMVVMKADIIENLLQSEESWNIRYLSQGYRFDKLMNQRQRLYVIQHNLYSLAGNFHFEWCKAAHK